MKDVLRNIRFCVIVLALVLCVNAVASVNTLTGMVMDISVDGIVLRTREGIRFAAAAADTVWDTDEKLSIGDVATVQFSGATNHRTVYADAIVCHKIQGTVSKIEDSDEPYLMLLPNGEDEAVRINLGDIPAHTVATGISVTVFYNGMRTRSIPPQITADYIRGLAFLGTVTGITDSGEILFLKKDGETVLLHISQDTIALAEPEEGMTLSVSVLPQMRLSIPAQYEVQDILPVYQNES